MTLLISHQIPQSGFLKIHQIIGNRKSTPAIPPLIPVGRTTFLNRVKSGEYPQSIKLGPRSVAWRVEDIHSLIAKIGGNHE